MKDVSCEGPLLDPHKKRPSEATSNELSMKLALSSGSNEIEKQARPILIRGYSNLFKQ